MLNKMYSLKQRLSQQGIIFSYSGMLSQHIIVAIGETLEEELERLDIDPGTINNLFSIFVEMSQNLISYSIEHSSKHDETEETIYESLGIILVGYQEDTQRYFVTSGNKMYLSSKSLITDKIEKIQNMDENELKAYFKELRKTGQDKHKRGAGLGLIEMQRKASEPLEYQIEEIDETIGFFTLTVYI